MDLTLDLLSIQNPWWRGGSLAFDPVIERLNQQTLKWRPAVLDELELKSDRIYCLYGFKGVGKTTLLKLIIKKLIEEDKVNSRNVFYYSCYNLDSYEQLNETIKLFLNSGAERGRRYVFIDEVGLVRNWRKGLDHLLKAGRLKQTTVILSASSAERKSAADGGSVRGKKVNSLTFSQFVRLINPALFKKITPKNYHVWAKKFDYYLDIYFLTGGFVSAINDFKENGMVRQSVYSGFLHWFLAYVARSGRDLALTKQIMEKLVLKLGQPLGFKTLTRKTKAKTHLTAAEYLGILESMFVIKTVYQSQNGQPTSRKAKKIYFQDPFIFWLFYCYIHGSLDYWRFSRQRLYESAVFSHLVENIVLSHLLKDEKTRITYWRDSVKKKEINFLAENKKTAPILIRYDQAVTAGDFDIFKQAGFKRGLIISRDELKEKGRIKIIPLVYFLLFY